LNLLFVRSWTGGCQKSMFVTKLRIAKCSRLISDQHSQCSAGTEEHARVSEQSRAALDPIVERESRDKR
jgi:hypothetical protein